MQLTRQQPYLRRIAPMLVLMVIAGCGYSLGYQGHPGIVSIAIPMFDNHTFPLRREIEYDITRAVRREIQSRTTLSLADSSVADMTVFGSIREFQERPIAEGPQDRVIESSLRVEVDLIVEDYQNRKRWKESVTTTQPFSVQTGETIENARSRVIENLAELIVNTLEAW